MLWSEWVHHGHDDALFWRSTPDEVEAVLKRDRDQRKHTDHLFGLVAAELYNTAGKQFKKKAKPGDFFRPAGTARRLSKEAQERFEARPLMRVAKPDRTRRLST